MFWQAFVIFNLKSKYMSCVLWNTFSGVTYYKLILITYQKKKKNQLKI